MSENPQCCIYSDLSMNMNIEQGDVNLSPQIIIYHAQLIQENSQYVPMYQYHCADKCPWLATHKSKELENNFSPTIGISMFISVYNYKGFLIFYISLINLSTQEWFLHCLYTCLFISQLRFLWKVQLPPQNVSHWSYLYVWGRFKVCFVASGPLTNL